MDNLKWKATVLEAEKLSKLLDCKDLQHSFDRQKSQITQLEADNLRLKDETRRLQHETTLYG